MPQTDGGYLGSDFEAFFSAVVSGAPGVYVGVLQQDAGIATDLVVRPGQRVSVSGDPSLPRPPRWGNGAFTVQQRGSLSLRFVEVAGTFSVSGGSLSLAQMALTPAQLQSISDSLVTPGSVVQLSDVTVPFLPGREALTGSISMGADGVTVYDPVNLVRSAPTLLPLSVRSSSRSDDDGSCSRVARRFSPLHRFSRGPHALLGRCGPTATRSADAALRSTAGYSTGSLRSATARRYTSWPRAAPCCTEPAAPAALSGA